MTVSYTPSGIRTMEDALSKQVYESNKLLAEKEEARKRDMDNEDPEEEPLQSGTK